MKTSYEGWKQEVRVSSFSVATQDDDDAVILQIVSIGS